MLYPTPLLHPRFDPSRPRRPAEIDIHFDAKVSWLLEDDQAWMIVPEGLYPAELLNCLTYQDPAIRRLFDSDELELCSADGAPLPADFEIAGKQTLHLRYRRAATNA